MGTIFDPFNTSLIFWEVVTFLILVFLLWRYVYPTISAIIVTSPLA